MRLQDCIHRIERIDYLIRLQATGSPFEFAKKLEMSESQLYEVLKTMKEMGAPITYLKNCQSYCYTEEVIFKCCFEKLEPLEYSFKDPELFLEKY